MALCYNLDGIGLGQLIKSQGQLVLLTIIKKRWKRYFSAWHRYILRQNYIFTDKHIYMIEKEIYIVRHGQTDLNAQGIVQGRGVNAPLNALGNQQANAFYQVYKHVPFDAFYSSSLLRAKQTIEPFLKPGIPYFADPRLDEISWGDMEGKAGFTDHSELFAELIKEWKGGNVYYKFPGGESPFDLQQRQLSFIEDLKATPYKRILIATHGRFIRILMCTFTETPLTEMDNFEHANLCLYKVDLLSNGNFKIAEHNNQAHLAELTNK